MNDTTSTQTPAPVLIDKAEADLAAFASDDPGRYAANINFVHVTPEYTEATNGHVLARLAHDGIGAADFPTVEGMAQAGAPSILIEPAALLKAIPRRSPIPVLERVHVGAGPDGGAVLTATDLESPAVIRTKAPECADYPKTDRVIPKPAEKPTICFAARYLVAIGKWAQAHGQNGRDAHVALTVKDADSAARLEVTLGDGRRALFVLMPVRSE